MGIEKTVEGTQRDGACGKAQQNGASMESDPMCVSVVNGTETLMLTASV